MPFVETCRMEERVSMLAEYDTRDIRRVGAVPPLWGEPGYVLRLAGSAGGR